jgi:hypothetical protein
MILFRCAHGLMDPCRAPTQTMISEIHLRDPWRSGRYVR